MKWILRLGIGLVALVGVAVLALAIAVPRLLDRPEVRDRISDGARQATGRELAWSRLEIGWLPPAFEVHDAVLKPAGDEAPLTAESISLRVGLLPLLGGVVSIDSLDISGAELELVRTADGFELPIEPPDDAAGSDAVPAPGAAGAPGPEDALDGGDADPIALAVRSVRIEDVRLRIVDESLGVKPPPSLALVDLRADASGGRALDAPIPFDWSAKLESGGELSGSGAASMDGTWSTSLEISELALAPLAPWVAQLAGGGRADGTLEAAGAGGDVVRAKLELALGALHVAEGDLELEGGVPVNVDLAAGENGVMTGPVHLDLTDARLAYSDTFAKPAGDVLEIDGTASLDAFGAGPLGLRLSDTRVELPGVTATVEASVLPDLAVEVSAPAFDPSGIARWLPATADLPATGRLALDGWSVALDPMRLGGAIQLEQVAWPLEGGENAVISGTLEGRADGVRGEDITVRIAAETLTASVDVRQLDSEDPFALLGVVGEGLDTEALLRATGSDDNTVSGALDVDAKLRAPLSGEGEMSERASGDIRFSIAPGRFRGVSLLRSTFDALGGFGEVALVAGQLFGGDRLKRFYGDEFERATGTVRLDRGLARTDDFLLEYRDYRVDLAGTYRVATSEVDMTGQLTMYEDIDKALAEGVPTAEGGKAVDRTIELSRVTGRLDDPNVTLTRTAVVSFSRAYLGDRGRLGRIQEKVDERLGEGAGEAVFDVLEGILGGGKRDR